MNRDQIFDALLAELHAQLNSADPQNFAELRADIERYLDALAAVSKLPLDTSRMPTQGRDAPDNNRPESNAPRNAPRSAPGYLFERKLKGGWLPEAEIWVPEKFVRQLKLEHGDRVSITNTYEAGNETRYVYALAGKGPGGAPPDRIEVQFCVVEEEAHRLTIQRTHGGAITVDDVPHKFIIREDDAESMHLVPGDVVDMAFYNENPETMRVLWKHPIGAQPEAAQQAQIPDKKVKKEAETARSDGDKVDHHTNGIPALKGKTILIAGGGGRQISQYRERLMRYGAKDVLWLEKKVSSERMAGQVRQSDVVALLVEQASHALHDTLLPLCKANNVPFVQCESVGLSTIVRNVMAALRWDVA